MVRMPVPAGGGDPTLYATLVQLKATLGITDTTDDAELTVCLAAASRDVDQDTSRRFWIDTATSSRTYHPQRQTVCEPDGERLLIDDVGSDAGLIIEVGSGSSWTAVTDYEMWPDNALVRDEPVTSLLRFYLPWAYWPRQRVRVTALWGWPAVPDPIVKATILRAARLYRRKGSPEGVAGFGDLGVVRVGRTDPDYDALIGPFVKHGPG